jgi:hypothetical protein
MEFVVADARFAVGNGSECRNIMRENDSSSSDILGFLIHFEYY